MSNQNQPLQEILSRPPVIAHPTRPRSYICIYCEWTMTKERADDPSAHGHDCPWARLKSEDSKSADDASYQAQPFHTFAISPGSAETLVGQILSSVDYENVLTAGVGNDTMSRTIRISQFPTNAVGLKTLVENMRWVPAKDLDGNRVMMLFEEKGF